jgi:RNA polymerase sigma-70 factor (ECF subfamily)
VERGDQRELVELARAGDAWAWECLYRAVYPKLYAFAYRRSGRDLAEDFVNETMTRAIGGIDGFRWGSSGFDGWLFGILRNIVADHFRREARSRLRVLPFGTQQEPGPGEKLELDEEHDRVSRAFLQLSDSERELLELRVIGDFSADEVAGVIHKRRGAVRTAQSRALAHLRRLLEQNE